MELGIRIEDLNLDNLDEADLDTLLKLLADQEEERKYNLLHTYFPEEGEFRRELYPQHMKFFAAGKRYRSRAFMAGNGTGKTIAGGVEHALHLRGWYPEWWEGATFPTGRYSLWVAGETLEAARDVLQTKLFGPPGYEGTGLIPKDWIDDIKWRRGDPLAIHTAFIRRDDGDIADMTFKSYDQKWRAFMGTERHGIWLDEEPGDARIFTECVQRTRTVGGKIALTFTPLKGLSETALLFLPQMNSDMDEEQMETASRFVVHCGWKDVPHLTEEEKADFRNNSLPHELKAREQGIPSQGSGAVYPVVQEEVLCKPFNIGGDEYYHWPRIAGFDVGWNKTAAVWLAWNRDDDIIYAYSEHYQGKQEPASHAIALQARGNWIPLAIDPASRTSSQKDGTKLFDEYSELLDNDIILADNTVEAGVFQVLQRLQTGRLKIFDTLQYTLSEMMMYSRDDKGKIIKKRDHLMDALRYGVMMIEDSITKPNNRTQEQEYSFSI